MLGIRTPFFAPKTSLDLIGDRVQFPNVVTLIHGSYLQFTYIVRYFRTVGWRRLVLLYSDNWYELWCSGLETLLEESGVEIVTKKEHRMLPADISQE